VYSLYGGVRKPNPSMLEGLDALVVDLQDVGARPYTYIWTVKLCMEACVESGLPLWILDRPNPVGAVGYDGPMLSEEYFSFVGGAVIPLCHRMTLGELAVFLKQQYFPSLELNVVWMENWCRNSLWPDTGLPWVLPSPNMPTVDTAIVYPGMVLLEATNVSEGRGSTRPFELWGAPYIEIRKLLPVLMSYRLPGCVFREHHFIPTFQKWAGKYCAGMQIHVTDVRAFRPVFTAAAILSAISETSGGAFAFKQPPYEYEHVRMPFDILSGDSRLRECIENSGDLTLLGESWQHDCRQFGVVFRDIAHYPEELR
jgi:uncharacterized protein YbbC (DUF1343 family)